MYVAVKTLDITRLNTEAVATDHREQISVLRRQPLHLLFFFLFLCCFPAGVPALVAGIALAQRWATARAT